MDSHSDFRPQGLIFGILFPGGGQMANGERQRGLLVMVGVLLLFFGGILIGGIDVVDSQEDRIWFIGEAMVGPLAFAVDQVHQTAFKAYDPAQVQLISTTDELAHLEKRSAYPHEVRVVRAVSLVDRAHNGPNSSPVQVQVPLFQPAGPGQQPPNRKSLSKVNELGTLFATIAGMMNLIAIIDAAFPSTRKKDGAGAKPVGAKA